MQSLGLQDTIVATATAPGLGALAIVRVSGVDAHRLVDKLAEGGLPPIRTAALRKIRSTNGEALDEAIVICYQGPHSYTGENTVEIICHGGWVTAARMTQALVESGARPAGPGDFTRRAVINGRFDLLQAEAVNDLIRSESSAGAKLALRQLDGGLSERILKLREQVLNLEAMITYEIDFPEEDDGALDETRIANATEGLVNSIDQLVATTPTGELVRHGAIVAIIGAPNVGKSSLFNALLGRKRALVTNIPGTTRDALEAVLDMSPVPLRLVDTAGLRETDDEVERLGVAVSREYLEAATIVLACGDSAETLDAAIAAVDAGAMGRVIRVQTKADLGIRARNGAVQVSTITGAGLDDILAEISSVIAREIQSPDPDSPVISHTRYRTVLMTVRDELLLFTASRANKAVPATISATHLRAAVHLLEEMIGSVDIEEILGRVFRSFCVGK